MDNEEIELAIDADNGMVNVMPCIQRGAFNPSASVNPYAIKDENDDVASLGEPDEVEKLLPVADEFGQLVSHPDEQYEPANNGASMDEVDEEVNIIEEVADDEVEEEGSRSVLAAGIESFKYLYSFVLLVLSVVVLMTGIFSEQTVGTAEKNMNPAIAFFFFWFLIVWLATMEGGQSCLVGLQPIDKALYSDSHPWTLKNAKLSHKGDNMERFIVGRQFLVVVVVFVANYLFAAVPGGRVFEWSDALNEVFFRSGVALIMVTIMLGQLTSQVNAANSMLDFINNFFMLYCVSYVSLIVEFSGILHAVYLVQIFFSKITGKPIESTEESRTGVQKAFFWARVVMSVCLLGFAFGVTVTGLLSGKTTMWEGVPGYVGVILFLVLMCIIGVMEGMQIALFAVVNMPEEELLMYTMAHRNCQLTFSGSNLQAFLIGRQICVTICLFVIARVTTLDYDEADDNVFGVSDSMQTLFDTGLLGAFITTIIASLAWRIIASSFPLAFLSNPLIYVVIRICLLFEASGLCSASWVLARYHRVLMGYQPDEYYLEGAEPQTAKAVTRRDMDIDRLVNVMKYAFSLALVAFSIALVMAAIFSEQTVGTADNNIHRLVAFFIFWICTFGLATMEGGQGALIGLQPVDKLLYAESHPRALKNTSLVHRGDNMERFIVGRQFLVVVLIFVTNLVGSAVDGASVLGLPAIVNDIFLVSGVGTALITIVVGQLSAQVNSASSMLDVINNYFTLYFVSYVSLVVEFSGLLHAVYLVQIVFSKLTGKPIMSRESPRSLPQKLFFWARVVLSLLVLGGAFAVTLTALFDGKSTLWGGVSRWVGVILFFVLICVVGMLEGVQVALFAVVSIPEEELKRFRFAFANCQLTFRDQNLQTFLIGRQICVTLCMFVMARLTTSDYQDEDTNIYGVSDSLQRFFNTGLLGAIITTIVASLSCRIIASSFSLLFLSNPLIYFIIRLCLLFEFSGVCSAAWVFGRWIKLFADYQPDEVYLSGAERQGVEPVTRRDKDIDVTTTVIKYLYSFGALIFSVTVIMAAIFTEQTQVSSDGHPLLAFFVFWGAIIWLAMMEGGQGCLVGLQTVQKELYTDSHPITLKSTSLAHKGDNMERFIIGRQFLVVLVVFVANLCGSAFPDTSVLDLNKSVLDVFLRSGVGTMLTTIMVGQLTAQINAANCMLDFINTHFMLFTTYVALFAEFSGLLHAVYFLQRVLSKITKKPIESKEPPRRRFQGVFYWVRVCFSVVVLGFALAVTIKALFDGKTTMWEGTEGYVSVIIYVVVLCLIGMLEGMQSALFACANVGDEELKTYKVAFATSRAAFKGTNLRSVLVGRQICVTVCMFIIARMSTLNYREEDDNIFGVPDGVQSFLNTGLMGTIITTITASLVWRVIASSFSVAFLSNPIIYVLVRACILLEVSGICSGASLLALIHKQIIGYKPDEVYIGTPNERAAAAAAAGEKELELELEEDPTASQEEAPHDEAEV